MVNISSPYFFQDESNSAPRETEKKKEKRQLGILEMATKEFEDDSEVRSLIILSESILLIMIR